MSKSVAENTWLTRDEVLAILQCSAQTLWKLIREGQVRTRGFGHRRYWREDVERLASPPDTA